MTLSKIHKISKEIELNGHIYSFESLSYGDIINLLQKIDAIQKESSIAEVKDLKLNLVNIVAYLKRIDDKEVSEEEKEKIVSSLTPEEVAELMKVVNEIVKEKSSLLEELKKNSK